MTEIVDDPTMVERVAKAIWSENQPAGAPAYEELDFLDQGRVKMIARACIKEMRKPSQEMIDEAYKLPGSQEPGCGWAPEMPESTWEAMIMAALQED